MKPLEAKNLTYLQFVRQDAVSSCWLLSSRASMCSWYTRQDLLWTAFASHGALLDIKYQTAMSRSRTAPSLHRITLQSCHQRGRHQSHLRLLRCWSLLPNGLRPCISYPPAGFKPWRLLREGSHGDALTITHLHSVSYRGISWTTMGLLFDMDAMSYTRELNPMQEH